MLEKYVDALQKGTGYQFICDNGHEMSKSDLCNIIKEFDYVVKDLSYRNEDSDIYLEYVADSIKEWYLDEENGEDEE